MDRIAVLDMDSIAYSISSPHKIELENGEFLKDEFGKFVYQDKTEDEIIANSKAVIGNILDNCLADGYIGFIKGKNTGKFRYQIKSDYKHNRSKERPNWWEFTYQHLINNYNIYNVDNYEVDDIVNIYRLKNNKSFIVAIDKDLLNLAGVHYNWKKNEWQANTQDEAELQLYLDVIAGQSGDGIKGIPGKGIVFAKKVLDGVPTEDLATTVLAIYQEQLANGVMEFCKNYACLKILDLNDTVDYDFDSLQVTSYLKGGFNDTK